MVNRSSLASASYADLRCGVSATHGPHHVAQKSSTTYLPLKSASGSVFPSTVFTEKSGAAWPTASVFSIVTSTGGTSIGGSSRTSFASSGTVNVPDPVAIVSPGPHVVDPLMLASETPKLY